MNTYTWSIDLTECFVDKDGLEKAIKNIYVSCVATNGTTYTKETTLIELDQPNAASFIPFPSVTQTIALGWVWDKMGAEKLALQGRLDNLIIQIENPETIFIPLEL